MIRQSRILLGGLAVTGLLLAGSKASGHSGPVTFESFSSAVVHPELSNTLAVWRNLWSDGEDLAKHAYAFLADHLR